MTAPDSRPGGCLHGPGARIGLCPNCGTVVDEAELARVAGTADVTCECGHGIDRHEGVGNWGCEAYSPPAIGKSSVCPCTRKPSQIAADAVAAAEQRAGQAEALAERNAEDAALWRAHYNRTYGDRSHVWVNADGTTTKVAPTTTASGSEVDWSKVAERMLHDLMDARARVEAAEQARAEVEAKVRAAVDRLAGNEGGWPHGDAWFVRDTCVEVIRAALSDAPEADAPVPQRDADALARAYDDGYNDAVTMARCYGHTDHWPEGVEPRNPYRVESAPATREAEDRARADERGEDSD